MGWVVVVKTTTSSSRGEIHALARAVWSPDDVVSESPEDDAADPAPEQVDHLQVANELFKGIEDIPEIDRARVVADRILADQIAVAPLSLGIAILVAMAAAIPIILGTVLGYFLLKRGNRFWVSYIRYTFAWWGIIWTLALSIALFSNSTDGVNINGYSFLPTVIAVTIFGTMTWLSLRRWRKEKSEPDPSTSPTVT